MKAAEVKIAVREGINWAVKKNYLVKNTNLDPTSDNEAYDNVPDTDDTGALTHNHFKTIVTSQIAKKWGGSSELAMDPFLTTVVGEKLEALIESVAGLERNVREILAKNKDR